MILLNRVIDIVESQKPPIYPPDIYGNPVMSVPCDDTIVLGMYYHNDTNIFNRTDPNPQPEPSQLDRIETEIKKKNEKIAQNAVDKYTEELMEQGVI